MAESGNTKNQADTLNEFIEQMVGASLDDDDLAFLEALVKIEKRVQVV